MIDTHAHLDDERFLHDLDLVIQRATEAGVEAILTVGISVETSQAAIQIAERFETVYAAVGIHPNSAAEARPDDWDRIVAMTDHPKVIAVGETGLDLYWDDTPFDVQQDYLARHFALSRERDLPILIHSRDCNDETVAAIRTAAESGPIRGLVHAFSGSMEMAKTCLELGLYISFAGMTSYTNKKFGPLREVAAMVPADRILLETDTPYLVPHPLRGKEKRNEPALMVHTARSLAEL
ncbi:MAG: TatD family hydrolase, partial [Planctomycetia bacterium]